MPTHSWEADFNVVHYSVCSFALPRIAGPWSQSRLCTGSGPFLVDILSRARFGTPYARRFTSKFAFLTLSLHRALSARCVFFFVLSPQQTNVCVGLGRWNPNRYLWKLMRNLLSCAGADWQ